MVTENTLCKREGKQVLFENNAKFLTAVGVSKLTILLYAFTCAPIFELPSNINTMTPPVPRNLRCTSLIGFGKPAKLFQPKRYIFNYLYLSVQLYLRVKLMLNSVPLYQNIISMP